MLTLSIEKSASPAFGAAARRANEGCSPRSVWNSNGRCRGPPGRLGRNVGETDPGGAFKRPSRPQDAAGAGNAEWICAGRLIELSRRGNHRRTHLQRRCQQPHRPPARFHRPAGDRPRSRAAWPRQWSGSAAPGSTGESDSLFRWRPSRRRSQRSPHREAESCRLRSSRRASANKASARSSGVRSPTRWHQLSHRAHKPATSTRATDVNPNGRINAPDFAGQSVRATPRRVAEASAAPRVDRRA